MFRAGFGFPSNAGRATAGAGGRNLREDALLSGLLLFFNATQDSGLFLPSPQLSRICIERVVPHRLKLSELSMPICVKVREDFCFCSSSFQEKLGPSFSCRS